MPEYIRKDILLEVLHEGREIMLQDSKGRTPVSLEGFIDFIKDIPTADVVEVVHGEWIGVGKNFYSLIVECSECGSKYDFTPPHCPNCGTKMDGKKVE